MPYARMTERLGLQAAALTKIATATGTQAVSYSTQAESNIIDSWVLGNQRYLIRAHFTPDSTAATGSATVAVQHGTATNAMSAASVGTSTTPMQATVAVSSDGAILDMELEGADLVGKNRYLQAVVTPGGSFRGAVALEVITEARVAVPNTAANVSQLASPVVVADL
jgi:hypothetical protein